MAADHRYRMVVADIDGTLLDSTGTLRPTVRDAVTRARRSGIVFTLATGRRYITTRPVLEALGLDDHKRGHGPTLPPVVLQTGALTTDASGLEVLYRDPVPLEDARRAIRILIDHDLQPIVYQNQVSEQRLFTGPADRDSRGARQYLSGNPHLVERRPYGELIVDEDPLQLAVIGDREPLEAAMPQLILAQCRTILSYSDTLDSYFMEVFHRTCNKGRATARVARDFGFTMADVVCVGDNWNDIEMLAMAGCGVAVANATHGVEPYARRRSPSNDEDAVAVLLDQVLAGDEPGVPNPLYQPALLEPRPPS